MVLQSIILIVHVGVGLLLIGLVLLQRGKGADAGAGFGAGASGTVFGARGAASFLSRTTAVLATLFFATSLGLAYLAGQPTAPSSLMEQGSLMEQSLDGGAEAQPAAGDETLLPDLPGLETTQPVEGEEPE